MSRRDKAELEVSPGLLMERQGLDGLPEFTLANGYKIRAYEPSDDAAWERIVGYCFDRPHDFESTLRSDPGYRPERLLMLAYHDQIVGTGCGWYRRNDGPATGYLQMICVMPRHRGKSLGYQLSLACLKQLQREGRSRALLHTDEGRWAAVRTYLRLGFEPVQLNDDHAARWRAVMARVGGK